MKTKTALLTLALCLAGSFLPAVAQSPAQKCPVTLDRIDVSFNHQGGQSVPQLRVSFGNDAGKRLSTVTFALSLLDSGGYAHPYPNDFIYRQGLDPGKKKDLTWDLAFESVDIHRTGETVMVKEVEFADATSWKDDGSESCELTVDFHPQ